MTEKQLVQWPIKLLDQDENLGIWVDRFLVDRKIEGFAPGTLYFYNAKLKMLVSFCEGKQITSIRQIDSNVIRNYLLWLDEKGHNKGGQHAFYRSAKTLIRWWANETEPENWKDPFKKVKAPKLDIEPLAPVDNETVKKLISSCNNGSMTDLRDKAIFLFLLDTGVRARELLSINLYDMDLIMGAVLIRQGKGHKPRTVFFGKTVKKAIKEYLRHRQDTNPSLWITKDHDTLTYWGLDQMFMRRVQKTGVNRTTPHDFRRAFALGMLRNGVDIFTIQKLMGHADLQVLRRYLAQTDNDLAAAQRNAGLADRL